MWVEQGRDILSVPALGESVEVTVEYVDGGASSFGISTDLQGEISYETVSSTTALSAGGPSCTETAYNFQDRVRHQTLYWYLGDGARPYGVPTADALQALRAAAYNIDHTVNPCGMGDRSNVTMAYAGPTSRESDIYAAGPTCKSAPDSDGWSTFDFGNLDSAGPEPLATTCNWGGMGEIWQSDIRYNVADAEWTTAPGTTSCFNMFDLQSVATHEDGHAMGLRHAGGDNSRLTMHPGTPYCSSWRRDLGRGDVLGLYWIDPT